MYKVGFVGWRGMVGSVLMNRMSEKGDFRNFEPHFFTTSQTGDIGPDVGHGAAPLKDATNISLLAEMDVIVSCQGSGFTEKVFSELRSSWDGYWIDAASKLRMNDDAVIVLDPVNRSVIDHALDIEESPISHAKHGHHQGAKDREAELTLTLFAQLFPPRE